jgi:hypothetical protein
VLLLVSENRDHGSHVTRTDDVVATIGNSNTVIYALAFSPSLSQVLDTERGVNRDEAYWDAPPDIIGNEEKYYQGNCRDDRRRVRVVHNSERV